MKKTERTRVKRVPKRGLYDRKTINAILDDHFLCHVGFVHEGYPVVIPTLYGRSEGNLYIHGATSSRMLRSMQEGIEVSVNITLLDGLVLARSAFHHSMNYRSVVIFGTAKSIVGEEEKRQALKVISDQVLPGRWEEVRTPNKKELKATAVLSIPIEEASAKVRTGPPVDETEDYDLDVWAGIVPLQYAYGQPVYDPQLKQGQALSKSVINLPIL